jgi:hypothetical protein
MRVLAAACWLVLVLPTGCGGENAARPSTLEIPMRGELNRLVLTVAREYPTDGRHAYWWPRGDPWRGTTRTLRYGGDVLCPGDPQGRCYCSGLTFEVFLEAWMRGMRAAGWSERVGALDLAGMKRFQDQWYGTTGDRKTLRTALVENGLGGDVRHDQAEPGDFVQFWRRDGSGHCAVFLAWERDDVGAISGLRYWSTQKSTNGIGERTESFGEGGRSVIRAETYVVRLGR